MQPIRPERKRIDAKNVGCDEWPVQMRKEVAAAGRLPFQTIAETAHRDA